MPLQPVSEARTRRSVQFSASYAGSSSTTSRLLDLVLMFAIGASLLDVATTWFALASARHSEQNPVMSALMDHVGLVPVLVIDLAIRLGIAFALAFIAQRAMRPVVRHAASATLVLVTAWWCAIVFLNSVVIGRTL